MKIKQIISVHKWKFSFTLLLIFLEHSIWVLFPLFIGFAIDDAIIGVANGGGINGAINLGILGFLGLLVGAGRRFFDSRFYAQVFREIGSKIISRIENNQVSIKTARLGMIRELVEFMENSLPELIGSIIGVVGVVGIIATLNLTVFWCALASTALVFVVYWATSKRTISLNKLYNDEIENQVDIIELDDEQLLDEHLKDIMKWNVKLSDLETANFSISWIVLMVFLVFSIIVGAQDGVVQYGALFALIMYVFEYIESVISLPLFYQNWLRLTEIQSRLEEV